MLRGKILFKCTQCSEKFKAPDVEYMASALSMLKKCPKCESIRTTRWRN